MVTVRFSGALAKLVNGKLEIKLNEDNVDGCINQLEKENPGVKTGVCDEKGEILDAIHIYLNGDNIQSLQGLSTSLKDGDELDIMSAFAAG